MKGNSTELILIERRQGAPPTGFMSPARHRENNVGNYSRDQRQRSELPPEIPPPRQGLDFVLRRLPMQTRQRCADCPYKRLLIEKRLALLDFGADDGPAKRVNYMRNLHIVRR